MNIPKYYYPTGGNPIHEVRDWAKVRRFVRMALRGDTIPPILTDGSYGNCTFLTGTHRAAANDILNMLGHKMRIQTIDIHDLRDSDDIPDGIDLDALWSAYEDDDYRELDLLWDQQF